MSRRRNDPPDSLELLLDTLCNTFGGVLFIAMLVAVLLQLSGESAPESDGPPIDSATLGELTDTLRTIRDEVEALEATLGGQQALVDRMNSAEIDEALHRLETAQAAAARLASARDRSLVQFGQSERRIREIDESLQSLEATLPEARRRLEEARERLVEAREARSRTIHAPVVHVSIRRSIVLIIRYERMYVWHRYDPLGNRLGPNLDEIVVVGRRPDGLLTMPDPTAGIPIPNNPTLHEAIARRLAAFSPDRFDLQVVVRADSFEGFSHLRAVLHELGYRCSLLLVTQESVVDRGGPDRGVQ